MIIKEKVMKRTVSNGVRGRGWWLPVLFLSWLVSGCYIPGLGALGDADELPAPTDPGGVGDTYYGRFNIRLVNEGKVFSSFYHTQDSPYRFYYVLGDTFYPSSDNSQQIRDQIGNKFDYNIMHQGDGKYQTSPVNFQDLYGSTVEEQTIFYKDRLPEVHPAAMNPEGVLSNGELALFYTHHAYGAVGNYEYRPEGDCGEDDSVDASEVIPPGAGVDRVIIVNGVFTANFNNNPVGDGVGDIDVYTLNIAPGEVGSVIVFRLQVGALLGNDDTESVISYDKFHSPLLSLHAADGTTLTYPNGAPAISDSGADFFKFKDPELTFYFETAGTFYLKMTDRMDTLCDIAENAAYVLLVESPDARFRRAMDLTDTNLIRKGEIQPARSGSAEYFMKGGASFEPDDLRTKVEDKWPDCDGIPGTGDEGDAGLFELCDSPSDWGAGDGKMEFYEVDNKSAIEDGEYFDGVPTNIGTSLDAEASIIHFGGGLLMAINYGSRIYVLKSLDGQRGLEWDLDPILLDRPAVVPRQQRGGGSPGAPVVSSGPLGFCETIPGPGGDDSYAAPELAAWAQQVGTTPTASGAIINKPIGFPHTIGVTYGGNHHLDSHALVDNYSVWNGMTVINSGPDGIINTFFAPRFEAYGQKPGIIANYREKPVVGPPAGTPFFGPGNLDSPSLFDADSVHPIFGPIGGYLTPLNGTTGGSNESAFLLGQDEWNPWLFDANTTSPAAYWERQRCDFYSLAENFDKCAQGAPVDLRYCGTPGDPATCDQPVSIYGGAQLETVQSVLSQFRGGDYLCRDAGWAGDTVAICPGPNNFGRFGGLPKVYDALRGDDVLAVVWDPAIPYNPASPWDQMNYFRTEPFDNPNPQPLDILSSNTLRTAVTPGIVVTSPGSDTPVPPYRWGDADPATGTVNWRTLGIDSHSSLWFWITGIMTTVVPPPLNPAGQAVIGIDPGPDGILQTTMIDSYTVIDTESWRMTVGGDHFCETSDHQRLAICPGIEIEVDLHWFQGVFIDVQARKSKRLMSAWPMYLNTEEKSQLDTSSTWAIYIGLSQIKRDYYSLYDDYFCIVNGGPAVCPGDNGYFQSYPVSEKQIVAHNDDLLALYRDVADAVGVPCYQLVSERYQETPYQDEKTRYVLYRYFGVLQDDRIGYNPAYGGFYVSTGPNGINQSCVDSRDSQVIGWHKGLPYQPIIQPPGAVGSLTTYPLADQEIQWASNVKKISTGADGIMNSFTEGDDNFEIFMGTGRPDMPCVLAGPNGVSETTAVDIRTDASIVLGGETAKWANDTQLYEPGEVAGFDAFNVWGPELMTRGNTVYLYYSALGWEALPEQVRDGAGALADKGECKRPGLDFAWGRKAADKKLTIGAKPQWNYDHTFEHYQFLKYLDNNPGVMMAPRIGVATSTVARLASDPSDWTIHPRPALDVGRVCGGVLDFPIELPLEVELPGMGADTSWNGACSPDGFITDAPDGEGPLFLMFFTGLVEGEPSGADSGRSKNNREIGLARSLDGMNFELVRELNPILISTPDFFDSLLNPLLGGHASHWANPTVVNAGWDEWGEPMYGMFFNQFTSDLGEKKTDPGNQTWDRRKMDHIGYAIRKGKITLSSCSLAGNGLAGEGPERMRNVAQVCLLLLPVALALAVRVWRRRET